MAYEDRAPVQPILFGGLDTHNDELFLPGQSSPNMRNVHLYPVGAMSKRKGLAALVYGASLRATVPGTGPCKTLQSLAKPVNASAHLYTLRDGLLYRKNLDSGVAGWVSTGITPNAAATRYCGARALFVNELVSPEVSYNDCLYLANKLEKPRILTGDAVTESVAWPALVYHATPASQVRGYPDRWEDPVGDGSVTDWPGYLSLLGRGFGAQLVAWGFALDPQRIDFSEAGVPYNFGLRDLAAPPVDVDAEIAPVLDGGFFYAERGDGDPVVSVRSFRDYIVVYKKFRILLYAGISTLTDPAVENPFVLQGSLDSGAVSHESVVLVGNDHYFWSPEGPRRLSATAAYGDVLEDIVSREIQEIVSTVSRPNLYKIIGRHEAEFGRVVWHLPAEGAADNNLAVAYYYPSQLDPAGRWAVFEGRYAEMVSTVMGHPASSDFNVAYGATYDGGVFQMNATGVDDYTDDVTPGTFDVPVPIELVYDTRWVVVSDLLHNNRALFMRAVVSDEGFGAMKFYYAWDYSNNWTLMEEAIGGVIDSGAGYWNHFNWDSGVLWNGSSRALINFALAGTGSIIRFRVSDDSPTSCGLGGLVLDARVKGAR